MLKQNSSQTANTRYQRYMLYTINGSSPINQSARRRTCHFLHCLQRLHQSISPSLYLSSDTHIRPSPSQFILAIHIYIYIQRACAYIPGGASAPARISLHPSRAYPRRHFRAAPLSLSRLSLLFIQLAYLNVFLTRREIICKNPRHEICRPPPRPLMHREIVVALFVCFSPYGIIHIIYAPPSLSLSLCNVHAEPGEYICVGRKLYCVVCWKR